MVSHCTQGCFVHFSENIKAEPSARESSIFVLEESQILYKKMGQIS